MYTLGINAVYHDPAAVLVKDGQVVAAAEEERFTQIKHGKRPIPFTTYELPFNAMDYVLRQAGITITGVDHIAYSYDPWLLLGEERRADADIRLPLEPSSRPVDEDFEAPWDPLFLSYIVNAPRQLAGGAPHHLKARFRGAKVDGPYKWHFVEHHHSHAASAFLPSPFHEAAILTLDGRGELATTSYDIGRGSEIERLGQVNMPHSLGILYEQVTDYLGFLHSSDEYKVMALASFGKRGSPNGNPRFLADFFEIITLGREGQFTVQQPNLEERFGPRRERGGPLEQRHYDVAYALQMALEETVLELVGWLHRQSGMKNLAMAGGVALNVVMNSCIRDKGPFEQIWVQPAAGDAGTALGAALWVDAQERRGSNNGHYASAPSSARPYCMDHAFLGPEYSEQEIENYLRWSKLLYRRLTDVAGEVADILAQDKIIGWFQGRHEFGPRALGARSILASPISTTMQARLNDIKDREDFRPVAPVVLEEEAPNWFMTGNGVPVGQSPFMLFVFDVKPEKTGMIPAVQHIDGTARIQTINRAQNPTYYDLLKAFGERTGVPILVNTSFNTRGKPIVLTPRDALETFWTSPLDALVIGPFILEKAPAPGDAP